MTDKMLNAALDYAAMGWYVFPLATSGDIKAPHPTLKNGHREASADPAQIRRWWTAFPTAGIGVWLARSGLIAVDIDPRNGGDKTMAALERTHGPLETVVTCLTGSGGWHRYFVPPDGLRSPPGHLGPDDGGIDLKYNGYVVLPPSRWAPKGREWAKGNPDYRWAPGADPFEGRALFLPVIPDWTLIRSGKSAVASAVEDDDPFVEVTPVVGLAPPAIRKLLEDVENEGDARGGLPYETWVQVLAGIYHETGGSAEGREIALDWSMSSPKHEPEEFDKTWRSLDIAGKGRAPTTLRFAMKLAKTAREAQAQAAEQDIRSAISTAIDVKTLTAAAQKVKPLDLDPISRESLMTAVRERYRAITGSPLAIGLARDLVRREAPILDDMPAWLSGWVYCAREDRFFRNGTTELISARAFNALHDVQLLTPTDIAEGQLEPAIHAATVALNRYKIPKVHGRMYLPGEGRFFQFQGSRYLNSYSAASVPQTPAVWTDAGRTAANLVRDHFAHLAGDPRDRSLLMSWLCSLVRGGPRPNWSVLLQGPEGDGKSFLVSLMGAVMGSENVKVLFASVIQESAFNAWAEGSQLTVVEEVRQHSQNRHVILDRLQPLITNDVIQVHVKGVDPYPARNTTAYLLLTNHRDALPVGAGDTRYFMIASPRQTAYAVTQFNAANPGYFDRLFDALNTHAGHIRKWMTEEPLDPAFNPRARAPRSAEHAHAVALATPELFSTIAELLEESTDPLVSRKILFVDRLIARLDEMDVPAVSQGIGRALLAMGFSMIGRLRGPDNTRHTAWSQTPSALGRTPDEQRATITNLLRV